MDDFLKLKLDKMKPEGRKAAVRYLLGGAVANQAKRKQQFEFELMSEYTEAAKEIVANWGRMQGLSTGFPSLDRLTKGLVGGEVTVIAARTSVGKTALAVNIANNVAIQGVPVLFVTLEMTKAQLTSRYLYINGGDTEDYYTAAALTVLQKQDELNWESIDGLIENFVENFTNGLVIIDHLHYFTRELQNAAEDIGRITKEFSKNAHRHNVPVVLISHVRKGSGDVNIDDLRGSSYIGQDADVVLTCGRSEDGSVLAVKVEKNRNRGIDADHSETKLLYDRTKITEMPGATMGMRYES